MATKTYAAMFEPTDGGFGISFPDLPGCVSFGEDLEACMRNAEEALSLHLEGMAEDGDKYPDASHYGDLVGNMNVPQGVVWASIKVEAPDAADRVNVYLPRSLLERVDRYVAEHAPMNRSTFFSDAARAHLNTVSQPVLSDELVQRALAISTAALRSAEEAIREMSGEGFGQVVSAGLTGAVVTARVGDGTGVYAPFSGVGVAGLIGSTRLNRIATGGGVTAIFEEEAAAFGNLSGSAMRTDAIVRAATGGPDRKGSKRT